MSEPQPSTHHDVRTRGKSRRQRPRRRADFLRRASAAAGAIALIIAGGLSAGALAAPNQPTKSKLIETFTGARISLQGASFESVYKVVSPHSGTGAAIQDGTFTTTTFPLTGKDRVTNYFADGVSKTTNTFEVSAPNASGIGRITGSGKCVGGTGVHKHERCAYTFTGTFDYNTTLTKLSSIGTFTAARGRRK